MPQKKSEFVTGLQFDPVAPAPLCDALKTLEAGVKGYWHPGTAQTRALTDRMLGEQEPYQRPIPLVANEHLQLGWDFERF